MSSIPGPIISFRIGGAELSGAIRPALDQIKREARNTSQQIADDWKKMAAQIRTQTALGSGTEKELVDSRKELVGLLQRQLTLQGDLSSASNKQLTNYKAMTLELERQKSALKGTGGITTGTANALNQVSTQTVLGLTRALDSFVDRFFGGVAGALTRTVRDVGYYSAQAGGQGGIKGGISGALKRNRRR